MQLNGLNGCSAKCRCCLQISSR